MDSGGQIIFGGHASVCVLFVGHDDLLPVD